MNIKKFFLTNILLFSILLITITVSNTTAYASSSIRTEYLQNGDYIIIEPFTNARSTLSNNKKATYYTKDNKGIFFIIFKTNFNYVTGVSANAISSAIDIYIIEPTAQFESKNAYVSGNTAYGNASVFYQNFSRTINISTTCDIYGNIR